MNNTLAGQIRDELVFLNFEAEDKNEMLEKIADWLFEKGYVTKEFKRSILERERLYPTGMKLDDIQFAIPHTDADYIVTPGVVFIQLKERLEFTQMATFDDKVYPKVIFLLMMHKDGSQVGLLQDIIGRCTVQGFVSSLEEAGTVEEVMSIIQE